METSAAVQSHSPSSLTGPEAMKELVVGDVADLRHHLPCFRNGNYVRAGGIDGGDYSIQFVAERSDIGEQD